MPDIRKFFVTGATGQLGGQVVDALLKIVPADAIAAGVRDLTTAAAASLRLKGVEVRVADYTRPDTLAIAFQGVDRLLLISSSENGKRRSQHRNVIEAAKAKGVGFIAYTSILHANTSPLMLAEEHRDTEAALAEAGLPFALLRNGWYNEVFTWRLPMAIQRGSLLGAAGDGRISAAARADYAEAAARVLAGGIHAGVVYELAGDTSFSLAELVAVASKVLGQPMKYDNFAPEIFRTLALELGVPDMVAKILANTDAGIAQGALFDEGGALAKLIGRPSTGLETTISAFPSGQKSPRI